MKRVHQGLVLAFSLLLATGSSGQGKNNDYLGEMPPAGLPTIFARGIISDGYGNRDMAISPDGNEIFYTLQFNRGRINVIMLVERKKGKWLKPRVAPFSGIYADLEPAFSPDGSRLYFTSDRPASAVGKEKDFDIWYVSKKDKHWMAPVRMDSVINSGKDEFFASAARNGDLYFTREMPGRKEDIVVSYFRNGAYGRPESLGDSVNTPNAEFNAYVDPDERFIIFSSYGRNDNGGGDLYISRKNKQGQWGTAIDLPAPINSPGIDYCPYVSPDGKYFFFTSNRTQLSHPFGSQITIKKLKAMLANAGNGFDDIYWVNFRQLLKTK